MKEVIVRAEMIVLNAQSMKRFNETFFSLQHLNHFHFFFGQRTDKCIPKQFVCDGQNDCTMGEDEQTCYGAEENVNQK